MSGLPNSESLAAWRWDSVERLLVGGIAGLGYLVKSLPTSDSRRDNVGLAVQYSSAEDDEGETITTAQLLGSLTLPLEPDALQDAGSILKNVGDLTDGNLTAGEICPASPAGPAVPTFPAEVDSLERLTVWAALTLNASLFPEALQYLQISQDFSGDLLQISFSLPLDAELLANNGGNFVAAVQRLATNYAVLDGSTGSAGGVLLPPPSQYWGVPVSDLTALGALGAQTPGMSRFVISEGHFYALLSALPDGETVDGFEFVAGVGDTVWRRVGMRGEDGEPGPAGADSTVPGPAGPAGSPGPQGEPGEDGLSAYQVAVANGFVGTEAQWLASLVVSSPGPAGEPGADGEPGTDGISAYQVALNNGFVGTEAQWLASLVGADGADGAQGEPGPAGSVSAASGLTLDHTTTPADPGAGKTILYGKTDGKIYIRPGGGSETEVGSGAGGGGASLSPIDIYRYTGGY